MKPASSTTAYAATSVHATTFAVLFAISFCHLLNDMMQSLLSAIYPQLKESLELNFAQVGIISATYQLTASMLQPLVGLYSDKHPLPPTNTGHLGFWWDMLVVAIFSVVIYFWAMRTKLPREETLILVNKQAGEQELQPPVVKALSMPYPVLAVFDALPRK